MNKKEILVKKIFSDVELDRILAFWSFKGKSVAMAFGTFDTINSGNIKILIEASGHADVLLVGLRSDSLVRAIKGAGNPLYCEEDRALTMASQMLVSGVFVHNQSDPSSIVEKIKPKAIACCSHATKQELSAYKTVEKWGGKVFVIDTESSDRKSNNQECCGL